MLIMAFAMAGISQTGVYYGGVSNRTLRETGLILRPEVGCVVHPKDFTMSVGVNMGYQFSPNIYVGGGMRFCIELERRKYNPNTGDFGYNNLESLYTSVRWYWLDRRSSPFLELDLGIGRFDFIHVDYYGYYNNYYDNYDDYYYRYVRFLPYLNIAIGYDIKNFDIKIGLGSYGPYMDSIGAFFTLGYNFVVKK